MLCVMALTKMFKLPKKYVAFFVTVPLLLATAFIQVKCPVCGGDGTVSSSYHMENVRLDDVKTVELGIMREVCTMFLLYNYNITLSVTNEGEEEAAGWVEMILVDSTKGQPLASEYTVLTIAGKTSQDVTYNVYFKTGLDEPPLKTDAYAKILLGDVPDKSCDGSGHVSLNNWVVLNYMKSYMLEVQRLEKPLVPPIIYYDEESPWDFEEVTPPTEQPPAPDSQTAVP